MAKRREATKIVDTVVAHRPCFAERRLWETPTAHALFIRIAGEDCVRVSPFRVGQRRQPDRLALGPDDAIGTILFELQPVTAVQQCVVTVGLDFQDQG